MQQVSLNIRQADDSARAAEWDWDRRRESGSKREGRERALWNSYKTVWEEKCKRTGWRRRLKTSPTARESRLPFVHTRYKLLMWALNKWVQRTGSGRWIGQRESPKITSKNGLVPSGQEWRWALTDKHQISAEGQLVYQNQWLLPVFLFFLTQNCLSVKMRCCSSVLL